MARLRDGEYERRLWQVLAMLRQCRAGLREQEIAEMLGWDRRVVNNYLNALVEQDQAYREGRLWFAG